MINSARGHQELDQNPKKRWGGYFLCVLFAVEITMSQGQTRCWWVSIFGLPFLVDHCSLFMPLLSPWMVSLLNVIEWEEYEAKFSHHSTQLIFVVDNFVLRNSWGCFFLSLFKLVSVFGQFVFNCQETNSFNWFVSPLSFLSLISIIHCNLSEQIRFPTWNFEKEMCKW